jgi:hypothetical protein
MRTMRETPTFICLAKFLADDSNEIESDSASF